MEMNGKVYKSFDFTVRNNTNHFERFKINNTFYRLFFAYNRPNDVWSISVFKEVFDNGIDIVPIIRNINVVLGVDLFKQYKHLGIGSLWVIPFDSYNLKDPTANTLSGEYIVEWTYEIN